MIWPNINLLFLFFFFFFWLKVDIINNVPRDRSDNDYHPRPVPLVRQIGAGWVGALESFYFS